MRKSKEKERKNKEPEMEGQKKKGLSTCEHSNFGHFRSQVLPLTRGKISEAPVMNW